MSTQEALAFKRKGIHFSTHRRERGKGEKECEGADQKHVEGSGISWMDLVCSEWQVKLFEMAGAG